MRCSLLAVDDLKAASALCEHFAHRAWPSVLNAFARMYLFSGVHHLEHLVV